MGEEKLDWLRMAEVFCKDGEFDKMRSAGREILLLDPTDVAGFGIMAESSILLATAAPHTDSGKKAAQKALGEAKSLIDKGEEYLTKTTPAIDKIRLWLAKAEFYWRYYLLDDCLPLFAKLLRYYPDVIGGRYEDYLHEPLKRALGFYGDAAILAGDAKKATELAFKASELATSLKQKASYYSKGLFLLNYTEAAPTFEKAKGYQQFSKTVLRFPHDRQKRRQPHSLRIGYISPDFRQHAVCNFVLPFFQAATKASYKIYAYSLGREDAVTRELKKKVGFWRDVREKTPAEVAKLIFDDRIDILVDLAGHSENNALEILAYKPAPVIVSGIGYTASTGLSEVDYFLVDENTVPTDMQPTGFLEKPLRLPTTHLCYRPELLHKLKPRSADPPSVKNGFITFG